MKSEKLKAVLESERERLFLELPNTDPTDDKYHVLLSALLRIEDILYYDFEAATPDVPTNAPAPVIEEAESAPAEDRPIVDTDDIKGETEYVDPEALRAELAEAKKKGVNIAELISSLGAANFSGLLGDQNKLRQLKTLMKKALEAL